MPLQQSSDRGQTAQWEVGAWTQGGNVADAKIQLSSTAGAGTPTFTFGCATGNGTSTCDLGAVDATSAQRLFQAAVNIPLTATLNAVSLTVTGSTANLALNPAASASVVILAAGTPAPSSSSTVPAIGASGFTFPTPTASAGGNASGLFPTVAPGSAGNESPVANVSALHSGGTPIGSEIAEIAGLVALATAMVLAITRLSIRRPAPRHAANSAVAATSPAEAPAERDK